MELRIKVHEQEAITRLNDDDLRALDPEDVVPYIEAYAQDLFRNKIVYQIQCELPEGVDKPEE